MKKYSKTFRVRITKEMFNRIKVVAKRRICDASDIARDAISDYLRSEQTKKAA